MVPFITREKELSLLIANIHASAHFPVEQLIKNQAFTALFDECIEINEFEGIWFGTNEQCVYALPIPTLCLKPQSIVRRMYTPLFIENTFQELALLSKIAFKHRSYWTPDDYERLHKIEQIGTEPITMLVQAKEVALSVLKRSPQELGIVCGPISTGGGTPKENLKRFNRAVYNLALQMPVFNQMPFESLFAKVHEMLSSDRFKHYIPGGGTSHFFIDYFYRPIFIGAGKQWNAHFLQGWEHSVGATEEREIFTAMKGARVVDLPKDFHAHIL